jgi:fucose permease
MKSKHVIVALLPMLLAYFVMGFMDVVGIATSYLRADFTGRMANEYFGFLSSVFFLWFLVLSIPTAMLMNRIGRKNTVLVSMAFTVVGVMLPYIYYSFTSTLVGFALLGIGNTILQVGINPLISNVVQGGQMTSTLTVGQVFRAVCSLSGPFIASLAAEWLGNWRVVFLVYGIVTVLTAVWLAATPVEREPRQTTTSFRAAFSLFADRRVKWLFFGMMAFLAMDIGINTEAPRLLMERLGLDASLTESVNRTSHAAMPYFACRMAGAVAGAFILARVDALKYFRVNVLVMLGAVVGLIFVGSETVILALIGVIGLCMSSLFPVILSLAMQAQPARANEVSGLMITAICGGAVVSPVMSYAVKWGGSELWAVGVLVLVVLFLNLTATRLRLKTK